MAELAKDLGFNFSQIFLNTCLESDFIKIG
jgi:hypothetical protein